MKSDIPETCKEWGGGEIKIKGLVHFQMKISPSFTHPQAILGVYDFFLMNIIEEILINILTHLSFIMALNGNHELMS